MQIFACQIDGVRLSLHLILYNVICLEIWIILLHEFWHLRLAQIGTHDKNIFHVIRVGQSLEHLLDMFKTLPDPDNVEYVFIVGPYLGESQVPKFMQENYPNLKTNYVVQNEMKGQSHAIYLAREYLHGPMMVVFSDSIIETDFSSLDKED